MNEKLAALLVEAAWTPRRLGQELNRAFGRGTVAVTAPYHWRDSGGVPREPLPDLVAQVLSRQLNRVVVRADIWVSDRVEGAGRAHVTIATDGLDGPWSIDATMEVADVWLSGGFVDRRKFLQASGAALAAALSPYLSAATSTGTYLPTSRSSTDLLVDEIQTLVPRLQVLDDVQGGAA